MNSGAASSESVGSAQPLEGDQKLTRAAAELLFEQQRIYELVIEGHPAEECLRELCLAIERVEPSVRLGVLVLDGTREHFAIVIAPSIPHLVRAVTGAPVGAAQRGTCSHAVREGVAMGCEDVAADPRWEPMWKQTCLSAGVRACCSSPIIQQSGQLPIGSVCLCFNTPRRAGDWENALVGMAVSAASMVMRTEQAAARLRATEQRRFDIFGSLPAAVYATDMEGRLIFWNQAAVDLWGREPSPDDRWCGSWRIFDPQSGKRIPHEQCAISRMLRQEIEGGPQAVTLERPDGSRLDVLVHPRPLLDSAGGIMGAVNMLVDVTERKKAEEARGLLASIIESSEDAVVTKSLDSIITSWNAGAERLFGYTAEEAVGQSINLIIPESLRHEEREIIKSLRAGNRIETFETVRVAKDGRLIDLSLTVSPVRDSSGRVIGASKIARDITARKQTERALRESERRLRLALDAGRMGTWEWSAQTGRVKWSPALESIHGMKPGQFLGTFEAFLSDVHPDDLERVRDTVTHSMQNRRDHLIEYRIVLPDGRVRWVEGRGNVVHDPQGRPAGMVGVCADVTARKRSELAIRESESRFRVMADAAPTLVWMTDPEQRCTWVNMRWIEFVGRAMDDEFGSGWMQPVHPDDLLHRRRGFESAFAARSPFTIEYRLRRHDGEYRWMLDSGVPLFEPSGEFKGYIGSCVDITDRRASEQALKESESRFRTLADNISQFAWMADPGGWIFWYNQRWYDYTGTTYEEMQGWGWEKVHHPDHVHHAVESWRRSLQSGEPWEDTFPLRHKDGTYGWFLSRAQPIRDENGNILRWFGTNTDITRQRLIEEELARHRAELEQRVEERTKRLKETYERLRLSERMAMMGTLSAGLGHDLGNLLVPVRVRLESLASEPLSDQAREDIEAIRTSAEYLRRLANGLRMLALDPERANSGEVTELESWWSDTRGVLKSVLRSGVELTWIPSEPASVQMSKAALTQVVFNLVQNAGDALREQSSGSVSVGWRQSDGHAEIFVADDGPGMTPEVLARCMEPFYTTKTRGISTGLGLVLVYGLVKDAGGTVEPASEPGRGTTFTIRVPLESPSDEVREENCDGMHAVVEVKDARVRSFLTGELRTMKIEVTSFEAVGGQAPIFVMDDHARLGLVPPDADVVFLGDVNPGRANVRTLGNRPGMTSLREAIREVIRSRRNELKAGDI